MIAKELITETFHPLKVTDSGTTALLWMDEYKVSHLPVVDDRSLLGLITETEIYNLSDPDEPVGSLSSAFIRAAVNQFQHVYEVIKLFDSMKLTLLPVVDDKNHYIGVITLDQLVYKFSKLTAIFNPGGIIILEINVNDYILTQIAQIVESNDAKILSLYLTPHVDSTKMEVTLKINKRDITSVLQTFNRYNYVVKASFSEEDLFDDLQDRYDSLLRYLDV